MAKFELHRPRKGETAASTEFVFPATLDDLRGLATARHDRLSEAERAVFEVVKEAGIQLARKALSDPEVRVGGIVSELRSRSDGRADQYFITKSDAREGVRLSIGKHRGVVRDTDIGKVVFEEQELYDATVQAFAKIIGPQQAHILAQHDLKSRQSETCYEDSVGNVTISTITPGEISCELSFVVPDDKPVMEAMLLYGDIDGLLEVNYDALIEPMKVAVKEPHKSVVTRSFGSGDLFLLREVYVELSRWLEGRTD